MRPSVSIAAKLAANVLMSCQTLIFLIFIAGFFCFVNRGCDETYSPLYSQQLLTHLRNPLEFLSLNQSDSVIPAESVLLLPALMR